VRSALLLILLTLVIAPASIASLRAQGTVTDVRDDFSLPNGQSGTDPRLRYRFVNCIFDGGGCGVMSVVGNDTPSPPHVLYMYGGAQAQISLNPAQAGGDRARTARLWTWSANPASLVVTFVGANGSRRIPVTLAANSWQAVAAASDDLAGSGGPIGLIRELQIELVGSSVIAVDDVEFADISEAQTTTLYLPLVQR
jgi:hypothetical protein